MAVTVTPEATIIEGESIEQFRMIVLLKALSLEINGMKMSRGKSAYRIIKSGYGLTGNKKSVYEQFNTMVKSYKLKQKG